MKSSSDSHLFEKGTILNDKWEILGHIASGGKGEVYRARQKNLNRDVAVKTISSELLGLFADDKEELQTELERFRREVLVMAQVRHPHVLQVFDYGQSVVSGQPLEYIVMEYIPGATLRKAMPQKGLRKSEKEIRNWVWKYLFPVLDGVKAIHDMGIIHRDLKPENVLLDGKTPKIADFGIAGGAHWRPLTRSYHTLGTLPYMAPEQFLDVDQTGLRVDVYALGKILYEALSGKMDKDTTFPLRTARLPSPKTRLLKQMDRIIQQATAKDPNQRFPSVAALKESLQRVLGEPEKPVHLPAKGIGRFLGRGRQRLFASMAFLLALLLLGGAWYHFFISANPTSSQSPNISYAVSPQHSDPPETIRPSQPFNGPAGSGIPGKDGATLRWVPGGEILFTVDSEKSIKERIRVDSFFMDETEVINHQYVEFLNRVLPRIRVADKVVNGDGVIWLMLGEVKKGYEPIIFKDAKFQLKDPSLAAHPVVRVTANGAEAYARFYGRRLPSAAEWLYAARIPDTGPDATRARTGPQPVGSGGDIDSHSTMHRPVSARQATAISPLPVSMGRPNAYGIRDLNENVSEWTHGYSMEQRTDQYFVLGSSDDHPLSDPESTHALARSPWEAFAHVGFRTVFLKERKTD